MPVVAKDLPLIATFIHGCATEVKLADGTTLKVKKARPKANGGRGVRSTSDIASSDSAAVQFNEHDEDKPSKWTSLAKKGRQVTWVLVGTWPHRAAVAMIDGVLTTAISSFPGAPISPASSWDADVEKAPDSDGCKAAAWSHASTCSMEEAVLVHNGLHGTAESITVTGEKLEVKTKGKNCERWCNFRGVVFRVQSANNSSAGKVVKETGAKMTWIELKGGWGKIVDGSVERTCAFINGGDEGDTVDGDEEEPPKKKAKECAVDSATGSTSSSSSSSSMSYPLIASAAASFRKIDRECEEFWQLEELLAAHIHGRNEDYNEGRIKKGKRPISFVLREAQAVDNPVLLARYNARKSEVTAGCSGIDRRERVAFHGTHPSRLKTLCDRGLLPYGHELNPAKSPVDSGYFGSCRKGVYVSRYADYTLKYANGLIPLEPLERCTVVLFKCIPGHSMHIEKMCGPIDPTPGYNSHSSPQYLEWFLFTPEQCCPTHTLTIAAMEDTRTASDDQ